MYGKAFISKASSFAQLKKKPYELEAELQELLVERQELLTGKQLDPDQDNPLLFVGEEIEIPDHKGGKSRWRLDLLFVDQNAIPTFVEIKLSTDSRIRREVVGQMIDYAANGRLFLEEEFLKERFQKTCKETGKEPEEVFRCLGYDGTQKQFWQEVMSNLEQREFRLLFVADELPPELITSIEFMQHGFKTGEVLGLEIPRFVDERTDETFYASRLFGTPILAAKKLTSSGWGATGDETGYMASLRKNCKAEEVEVAKAIIGWSRKAGLPDGFCEGKKKKSFIVTVELPDGDCYPVSIHDSGDVRLQMLWLKSRAPFDQEDERRNTVDKFGEIVGERFGPERCNGFPSAKLASLVDSKAREDFLRLLDSMVSKLRGSSRS